MIPFGLSETYFLRLMFKKYNPRTYMFTKLMRITILILVTKPTNEKNK